MNLARAAVLFVALGLFPGAMTVILFWGAAFFVIDGAILAAREGEFHTYVGFVTLIGLIVSQL